MIFPYTNTKILTLNKGGQEMGKGSGYKITVEGQYFVKEADKGKTLKQYSFDINLPSMDRALSIIKNHILDKVLSKKYPDYCGFRTHDIVNVEAFGNVAQVKAVLWQMNRPTIISYIREQELPVKEYIYEKIMDLRQAVESCEADLDNYMRIQEKREEEYKLLKGISSLNPEWYDVVPGTPEEVNPPQHSTEEKTSASYNPRHNQHDAPELHIYNSEDALADFMD